jgi:hypothetical protein
LGFLYYKKSQTNAELKFLIFSSLWLGLSFLIRESVVLFIIPLFGIILIGVLKKKTKILSFFCFILPLFSSYFLSKYIASLKLIQLSGTSGIDSTEQSQIQILSVAYGFVPHVSTLIPMFGLLFAPGLGLFIFSPILLTMFFTFPDFFRKHKSDCILFSSFFIISLFYFANIGITWHGLTGWGPRYLFMVIPFLLIPLGSSLEKRNLKFMFILILSLGTLGVFFNISYVVQDTSWFVWGQAGSPSGLYGLGIPNEICDYLCQWDESNMYIHDNTIWTFQYSQLTHSVLLLFQGLQHDIYLLHLFGSSIYWVLLISSISIFMYLLWKVFQNSSKSKLAKF